MPTFPRPKVFHPLLLAACFLLLGSPPAEAQTSVTPDGGTATADAQGSGEVTFIVENPDPVTWTFDFTCSVSGAVTSCSAFPTSATLASGASTTVSVSFSTGAAGSGTVSLFAEPQTDPNCDPCFPASGDGGWYDVTVIAPTPSVAVLPDGDTLRTAAGATVRSASFTVQNGDVADTYTLSCSPLAPVSCVGVTPSSASLLAGRQTTVQVDYTSTTTGTGRLTLTASSSQTSDDGHFTVVSLDPATVVAPSVVDVSENNDFHWAKERCLTFAVGQGLVQCGDYVLVHSMPTFRTFNRDRAPTLIYNSGTAEVRSIVHSKVTFPANGSLPSYFSVALFFNGETSPRREAFYSIQGYSESVDETRRMSAVLNADAIQTGVYPYVLEARSWYSYESRVQPASGKMIVVNRRTSPYGAGWWLAGLERLYVQGNGDGLVVLGDGSAKLFASNGDGTYTAPAGEYSRLQTNATEGGWDRVLRGGGRAHFEQATGRHIYTDDPDGNRTSFFYNASVERVDSIRVEPTQVRWAFHYGADNVLDSIVDPAARVAKLTTTSDGRVHALYYPDGARRRLEYASGRYVPQYVYDERGNRDQVFYDTHSRPNAVFRPFLPGVGAPQIRIRSATALGVETTNTSPTTRIAAVDPNAIADTLIDPRGNKTVLRENIFGEPTYVRDALGQETVIARNANSEPTRVLYPNRRVVRLAWNDGRLTEFWDSTYAADHGLTGEAKTAFLYSDPACPHDLTEMRRFVGATETLTTVYAYQPPGGTFHGCRLNTATDEGGHVTEFAHLTDGRLQVVTEKQVPVGPAATLRDIRTTLAYWPTSDANRGARGNLRQVTGLHPGFVKAQSYPSPTDTTVTTTFYYDSSGNINQRVDGAGHTVWQHFTSRNLLDTAIVVVGAAVPQWDIHYAFSYDSAGNRTRVWLPYYRQELTSPGSRRFTYNAWNLVEKEYAESNDSTVYTYDLAGNVANVRNPNGHVIQFQYDALNRVILQAIPEAIQPYAYESGLGSMPVDTIPADTLRWHYDAVGAVDTLRTLTTSVARSYFLDGTLRSETQGFGGRSYALSHEYDLAARRTALHHPANMDSVFGNQLTTYAYSGTDLASIVNPLSQATLFQWDGMGRLTQMAQSSGVKTRRFYNDAGNLDSLLVTSPTFYLPYDSINPAWAYVDTLIYASRPKYDRDGFIAFEYETSDARVFRNAVLYNGAHRLDYVEKLFLRCQYTWVVNGDTVPPNQHCGAYFHPSLINVAKEWRGHDARGNQTEDDEEWAVFGRGGNPPIYFPGNGSVGITWNDLTNNLRNQHESTSIAFTDNDGRDNAVPLFQKFDRAGNLRGRVELSNTLKETFDGSPPIDSIFHYYTAADKLAKSVTHGDLDRDNACVYWSETSNEYDGFGRRVRKLVDITAWKLNCADAVKDKDIHYEYIYDGDHILYERITEIWGPLNPIRPGETRVTEILYTRGPSGEAISRHVPGIIVARIVGTDTISLKSMFYHLNTQNTPVATTDSTGKRYFLPTGVVGDYIYQAGLPGVENAPWIYGFRISSLEWRGLLEPDRTVGYVGQPYDAETGLHYFRNRYYDGRTGRFTQEDPIGLAGGSNLYSYASGNPINFTDPFGLSPCHDARGNPIPCLNVVANVAAGFGDAVTLGATNWIRDKIDANGVVDRESVAYLGGEVTGVVASVALGGATAKAIREGTTLATSGPVRSLATKLLSTRTGQALFGKAGRLNTGRTFRIGLGKLGGETGRAVLRVAGSAVKAVAGVEHVNLVDLGRLVRFF